MPDAFDEERADQNDDRSDEERPLGRRRRELDPEQHEPSLSLASDETALAA